MLLWIRILLDKQVRSETAEASFDGWLKCSEHYRPTVQWNNRPELLFMATTFDAEQRKRGSKRRVWPPLPITRKEERLCTKEEGLKLLDEATVLINLGEPYRASKLVRMAKRYRQLSGECRA